MPELPSHLASIPPDSLRTKEGVSFRVSPIVYGVGGSHGVLPTSEHAKDIVAGLKENWTYTDRGRSRLAYAHPERLDPEVWTTPEGVIGSKLVKGDTKLIALQDGDGGIVASALLLRNPVMGNVEIGSVQSRVHERVRGMGKELLKLAFRELGEEPIVFLDTAKVRTPMEGSPRAVAMPHPESEGYDSRDARIVSPTYIIGNQFGDETTRWGSNGDFAFSVDHLARYGAFQIPMLNRSKRINDGAEDIIEKVAELANTEGEMHNITVFGNRVSISDTQPFNPYQITPLTAMVDYKDTETREMLTSFGQKPTGVEFGVKKGELIVGVHYSPIVPPEVSFGPKRDLTPGHHPIHTTIPSTGELASFVRNSMR